MDELDTGAPVCGAEVINGLPMLPLFIAFLHDHWEVRKLGEGERGNECSLFHFHKDSFLLQYM